MKKVALFIALLLFPGIVIMAGPSSYRDSLDVVHYNINIEVNTHAKYIGGYTELLITSEYNLDSIKLDLWGLFVDSVMLDNKKVPFVYLTNAFAVKKPLLAGDTVYLKVFYHGAPNHDVLFGGFYFSKIDAYNYGIGMRSKPLSLGRAWFPANDNFRDKATFEFHITTDSTLQAVCNGLPTDTTYVGYKTTWSWKLKEPIPAYLANVAVGNYNVRKWTYHGIKRDIPVMIFIPKQYGQKGFDLFDDLDKVMKVYEDLYGEYVWDRIGYVVTSSQAGAMEHATNISLPSFVLKGGYQAKQLIYHELAHSWFGNLVTCATAKDMWLNEGWATYSEYLYQEKLYGEEVFRRAMLEHHFYTVNFAHIQDDGYKAVAEIPWKYTYGNTVYDKGADVIHTLRYYAGDEKFFKAVRKYLKTYAWKNITTEEFKDFIASETNTNLDDFFDFWLYSRGFPHFQVYDWYFDKRKTNKGYRAIVTLKQKNVGGKNLWKDAKTDITFVGKNNEALTLSLNAGHKWNVDTVYLPFKPLLAVYDKDFHITSAENQEYKIVDTVKYEVFDYELFDLNVTKIKEPKFVYVRINWTSPDTVEIPGYLLQRNYYWTVKFVPDKHFDAAGRFYLTTLMDLNFTRIYKPSQIVLLYRPAPYAKWQPVEFRLEGIDYLEVEHLKPGEYIFAVKK